MSMNPSEIERVVASSLHEHWKLFVVEGVVLLVLGVAAVIVPAIATLAYAIVIGWLFLIMGAVGLATTYWMRHAPGFWWSLVSAVLAIAVGVALIGWPFRGEVSLTLLLIAFFLIEGIASIMYALEHRRELSGRWSFMLMSGIIDLTLGGIIFSGLPETAMWAIGLLVGINMLFGGGALIAMGLHAKSVGP
jgi:uncharacterized membrane protein HdeD (DUF308 family)